MLEPIVASTKSFVDEMPKAKRKAYGQFFTTELTARFMASLFHIDTSLKEIRILDAGAGTGILTAALLEKIVSYCYKGSVHLVCYENDDSVLSLLKENLNLLAKQCKFTFEIRNDNYLTTNAIDEKFDYIIGNPPYKKISKDADETHAFEHVCHGSPNLYFLFLTRAIETLKDGQELVYIIPRSWTSGAYFAKFRKYLFSNCVIEHIHLFDSRDKVFGGESVLQETMILKIRKTTQKPQKVMVTSSSTSEFYDVRMFEAPYEVVVAKNLYVFLVTNSKDAAILSRLSKLNETLSSLNHPMKTGLIVDFRTKEVLRDSPDSDTYPLLYAKHIKNGRISWPSGSGDEYICTDRRSFLQENTNYLLVKRFTAKEEKRRLQCGVYLKTDLPNYKYLSTQNKVNFIKCESPEIAYGMYALLNSTIYDSYYRVLNGSTQVNSTEVNNMPVPDIDTIASMGKSIMGEDLTEENCNKVINEWIL